ncbi:8269_t:CDS:1, partial [Gigaspora rosea]
NNPTQVQESTSQQILQPSEINRSRQTRRATTEAERNILLQLFEDGERMPEVVIPKVILELQTISSDWNEER